MRRISRSISSKLSSWGLFSAVSSAILLAVVCEMGCSPSVGADGTGTVLFASLESINLSLLLHAAHDSGDHPNGVQQLAVHVGPVPDPPQLGQHSGQFVPQGLIHPGIALHYHVPAQEPLGDVVLLRQAREPHSGVDLLVFLRGYPE